MFFPSKSFLLDFRANGMSFETSSCKLHGDYSYNPTFSPLMDECNIFEVSPLQQC